MMFRFAAGTILKSCAGRGSFTACWRSPVWLRRGNIQSNCLVLSVHPSARSFFTISEKEKESYGTLVYSGPVNKRVRFIKTFSVSTSVLAIMLQPYFLNEYISGTDAHAASLTAYLTLLAATGVMFITPVLLHYLTKRYVLEIYRNGATGEYRAILMNLIAKEYSLKFNQGDVVMPENPGPFYTMLARNKQLFVVPDGFIDRNTWISFFGETSPVNMDEILENDQKSKESQQKLEKKKMH